MQRATYSISMQHATCDRVQHTTSQLCSHATCSKAYSDTQHTADGTQHAACNMQHAARSTQHAARSMQHAACNTQHATRSVQHGTAEHAMQHTTCSTQQCNMQCGSNIIAPLCLARPASRALHRQRKRYRPTPVGYDHRARARPCRLRARPCGVRRSFNKEY